MREVTVCYTLMEAVMFALVPSLARSSVGTEVGREGGGDTVVAEHRGYGPNVQIRRRLDGGPLRFTDGGERRPLAEPVATRGAW